jgi:hypothetical protein
MESFSEDLFVDEGSEWSPSESSSMSCDLSDDWSMDSHLRSSSNNKNEGISDELSVEEGSEWIPSESSSTSCDLSDDWSMDSHSLNNNEGSETELDILETELDILIEEARCEEISEMT